MQSVAATVPLSRELPDKSNHVNEVKEPSSDGTVPVKALNPSDKRVNMVKAPSSDGTVPLNEL